MDTKGFKFFKYTFQIVIVYCMLLAGIYGIAYGGVTGAVLGTIAHVVFYLYMLGLYLLAWKGTKV